uniref:Uncharacterized protein n=1 Tax=Rhizophora mucronata TaxID=61149 RepID=A0A2P2PCK5_RHIMU
MRKVPAHLKIITLDRYKNNAHNDLALIWNFAPSSQ